LRKKGEEGKQGLNASVIILGASAGAGLGDIFFKFVILGTLTPAVTNCLSPT
jgi:hypothetical protein